MPLVVTKCFSKTWKNIPKTTWEAKGWGVEEGEYFLTKTGLVIVEFKVTCIKG